MKRNPVFFLKVFILKGIIAMGHNKGKTLCVVVGNGDLGAFYVFYLLGKGIRNNSKLLF